MLQLHGRMSTTWDAEPMVLRIATGVHDNAHDRAVEAFLLSDLPTKLPSGYAAYLAFEGIAGTENRNTRRVGALPEQLRYLREGDIVRISPTTGHVSVLYRRGARFNSMLLTEQCNSYCVMCSQPPKQVDDRFLADIYMKAIPLMARETPELGLTGGEPTLLGDAFLEVISACKTHLPTTALHILSNGRMFNYLSLCQDVAAFAHPDLMIGIPVYSDLAWQHDFVVQAPGAFDQTIRGIMNLERSGVRTEIRVVIHRYTAGRLPQLAQFIARNLTFVDHVALMGLEATGFAKANLDALWIDPVDYMPQLAEAVELLNRHGIHVSIYNHQLCTLPETLWAFARQSISDWKNEYLDECHGCDVREQCGGFFSTGEPRYSKQVHPITKSTHVLEASCGNH